MSKITRSSLKELIRQSIDELNEDSGDMDNDGIQEPDDEEYMDNKDAAIKKAMKTTKESLDARPKVRLKDIGNVSTRMPALGQFVPNKYKKK